MQFVVPESNFPAIKNMSINIENESRKTEPLTLLGMTDKTINVELSDGRMIELKRDLVDGIIYLDSKRQITSR